jgi:hypothetical protein
MKVPRYNWNIVESGVKDNRPLILWMGYLLQWFSENNE